MDTAQTLPRGVPKSWVVWFAVVWLVVSGALAATGSSSPGLRCRRRYYRARVSQTDPFGRTCWDSIKLLSCWGLCDSNEISDWQFPYKQSHHPVCVHGARRPSSVLLRHCDPGVEPGAQLYHYMEAKNCKCQVCSSEDTSCEWLPPNSTFSSDDDLQRLDSDEDED